MILSENIVEKGDYVHDFFIAKVTDGVLVTGSSPLAGLFIYAWNEQLYDGVSGQYVDLDDGRFGTIDGSAATGTLQPAIEINNTEITTFPFNVWIRYKGFIGGASGVESYEFDASCHCPGGAGSTLAVLGPSLITGVTQIDGDTANVLQFDDLGAGEVQIILAEAQDNQDGIVTQNDQIWSGLKATIVGPPGDGLGIYGNNDSAGNTTFLMGQSALTFGGMSATDELYVIHSFNTATGGPLAELYWGLMDDGKGVVFPNSHYAAIHEDGLTVVPGVYGTDGIGNVFKAGINTELGTGTGAVTLSGDVSGSSGANIVDKLSGVPLGTVSASSGYLLLGDGTVIESKPVTGDITLDGAGVTEITALQSYPLTLTTPATGEVLTFDGTDWVNLPGGGAVTLAGDVSGLSGANTVDKIKGASLGTITATSGSILVGDGTDIVTVPMSGDIALNSAGATEVVALQGYTLSISAPVGGDLLVYTAGAAGWKNFTIGGDVSFSAAGVATVAVQKSITSDSSGLLLDGDILSPGLSKYYGTDSSGAKSFYDLPVSTTEARWRYDSTSNAMADPGSGKYRTNQNTFGATTQLAINKNTTGSGVDRTNLLKTIRPDDIIAIQDESNATNWVRYRVNATVTNNTSWFQIPVETPPIEGGGTAPSNNTICVLSFTQAGGGGGGTVTLVSGTTDQISVATGSTTPVISLTGPHNYTTQTNHGILIGAGTGAVTATAAMAAGQLLVGQSTSTDPLPKTISGAISITSGGVASLATVGSSGTFGSSTQVPVFTTDSNGRVISVTNTNIAVVPGSLPLTSGHIIVGNGSNVGAGVAMTGDLTISNTGATTIANSAVTYAKIQNVTASKLLGNPSLAGTAAPSEISLGSGLSFLGTTLNASGSGGTVTLVTGTAFQIGVTTGSTTPVLALAGPHNYITQPNHGIILGAGTNAFQSTAAMLSGELLIGQGTTSDPNPMPMSGDVSINNLGATLVQKLQGGNLSIVGPTMNQVLAYTGTTWVNSTPPAGPPTGAASGDLDGTYPGPLLATIGTAGTNTKITYDAKGRVLSGTTLATSDLPAMSGLTAADVGLTDAIVEYNASAAANRSVTAARLLGFADPAITEGRLTLTSGTAVTSVGVASGTLYFTPYNGNRIALYDGTRWKLYTFSEVSVSVAAFAATAQFDIFIYDNAGTLTLSLQGWASSVTRTTTHDPIPQDGVLVCRANTTLKYLGTVRLASAGAIEDSTNFRYCWNHYNQKERILTAVESTFHTSSTAGFRTWNGGSTPMVQFVQGNIENPIKASAMGDAWSGGLVLAGMNGSMAMMGFISYFYNTTATRCAAMSDHGAYGILGYNYIQGIEWLASGTAAFQTCTLLVYVWA